MANLSWLYDEDACFSPKTNELDNDSNLMNELQELLSKPGTPPAQNATNDDDDSDWAKNLDKKATTTAPPSVSKPRAKRNVPRLKDPSPKKPVQIETSSEKARLPGSKATLWPQTNRRIPSRITRQGNLMHFLLPKLISLVLKLCNT